MDAFWNFLKEFGKWFGLLFIVLAFFGGLINGIVTMTYQFWSGFMSSKPLSTYSAALSGCPIFK